MTERPFGVSSAYGRDSSEPLAGPWLLTLSREAGDPSPRTLVLVAAKALEQSSQAPAPLTSPCSHFPSAVGLCYQFIGSLVFKVMLLVFHLENVLFMGRVTVPLESLSCAKSHSFLFRTSQGLLLVSAHWGCSRHPSPSWRSFSGRLQVATCPILGFGTH